MERSELLLKLEAYSTNIFQVSFFWDQDGVEDVDEISIGAAPFKIGIEFPKRFPVTSHFNKKIKIKICDFMGKEIFLGQVSINAFLATGLFLHLPPSIKH